MSSEPIASSQPSGEAHEPAQQQPRADAPTAFSADAALAIAAMDRMQAVLRGERATVERLRDALIAILGTVADAREAMSRPADLADLLDELEHRIDGLVEMTGGEVAALSSPADQAVPTVSGVVSRLGRGEAAAQEFPEDTSEAVSRLKGMVEALRAEVPAEPAAAEALPEAPITPAEAALPEAAPWLVRASPFIGQPIQPESELLASVALLQALPILPPEVGSAVIFARAEPPPAAVVEPAPEAAAPDLEPALAQPQVETDLAPTPPVDAEPPPKEVERPPQAGTKPVPAATDTDLSAFLFGPDLDPPVPRPVVPLTLPSLPAVNLTEPAASGPPEPAAAFTAPVPAQEPQELLQEPTHERPQEPPQETPQARPQEPPHDPLAPLKAMSAEERLALFS